MRSIDEIRSELGRSAEEATYLAVGLGVLAVRELNQLRRQLRDEAGGARPTTRTGAGTGHRPSAAPWWPEIDLAGLASAAGPLAGELKGVIDGLGRFARDRFGQGPGGTAPGGAGSAS